MDGTEHLTTWALAVTAVALLASGCSSAHVDGTPTTGVAPITTAAPARTTVPAPTQGESPGPVVAEPPSALMTAPATATTTTKTPGSAESDGDVAPPMIIENLDTDELDALLADLDRILGDLDGSFAQDEGDIFDE